MQERRDDFVGGEFIPLLFDAVVRIACPPWLRLLGWRLPLQVGELVMLSKDIIH